AGGRGKHAPDPGSAVALRDGDRQNGLSGGADPDRGNTGENGDPGKKTVRRAIKDSAPGVEPDEPAGAAVTGPATPPSQVAARPPLPSQVREEQREYSAGDASPEQRWADYKAHVKKQSPSLGSNIEQGTFISYTDGTVTVSLPVGFACDYVREREHLERLLELARPFFGDQVKLQVEIIKPSQGDLVGKPNGTARNNHDLRQEAMNHPLLQKAIDLFEGAEVREIIPRRNS
ncbi:MAG: hypothetical protein Q8K46_01220, partial [Deltaproteobacteria bacterium]|nr:hypothetical protein [Deltaproteobacteria bacterium]